MTKGPNGAFAEYLEYQDRVGHESRYKSSATELNLEEWLDFINQLYTCRVDKWDQIFNRGSFHLGGTIWELTIFFSDKKALRSFGYLGNQGNPPDFKKVVGIMDSMEVRIKEN